MRRAIRELLAGWCLLVVLLAWAGQAAAVPLPGAPAVGTAGESDLNSFIVGAASDLTVDWMVIADPGGYPGGPYPGGSIIYLFQLENTTGVPIDGFTVTFPAGSVIAAGILAGDDLDVANAFHPLAHGAGAFPILAGEEDPFPLVALALTAGTPIINPGGNVTWTFTPLAAGSESDTLFFVSPNPPIYGFAVASDQIPPSPWGSLAAGSDPVPVPFVGYVIPEPASLFLLGSGLLGVAAWARRRAKR